MTDRISIPSWFNPLSIPFVDVPASIPSGQTFGVEELLQFLVHPDLTPSLSDCVSRYGQVNHHQRLVAVPREPYVLNKLIWPLRHAKASYVLGNYLGTIALCGLVAEMVAILTFEMSGFTINGKTLGIKDQATLFGSSFEKLGQERRERVLLGLDLITNDDKERFELIRSKRNKYLHSWSLDHADGSKDAVEAFDAAVYLVANTIGQDLIDGGLVLNPKFLKYLEGKGVIRRESAPEGPRPD